jgi:hypothetical protein
VSDSLSRESRVKAVPYVAAGDCHREYSWRCRGANGALRSDKQLFCCISTEIDTEPIRLCECILLEKACLPYRGESKARPVQIWQAHGHRVGEPLPGRP